MVDSCFFTCPPDRLCPFGGIKFVVGLPATAVTRTGTALAVERVEPNQERETWILNYLKTN